MNPSAGEVTQLLNAWCGGDAAALGRLAPLVEAELHRLARAYLSKEEAGHTLQPTALINEAYVRLIEWNTVGWQNRAHFYAVAAKMMRRVLVNQALSRSRQKRAGSTVLVSLTAADEMADRSADIEALIMLGRIDDRKSQLVELRFFGGLTAEEDGRGTGDFRPNRAPGMGLRAGLAFSRAARGGVTDRNMTFAS